VLAGVSLTQLAAGLAGMTIAIRKGLPSDPVGVHLNLSADHLARNQIAFGTARSAPGVMLAIQAIATATLLKGWSGDRPSSATRRSASRTSTSERRRSRRASWIRRSRPTSTPSR